MKNYNRNNKVYSINRILYSNNFNTNKNKFINFNNKLHFYFISYQKYIYMATHSFNRTVVTTLCRKELNNVNNISSSFSLVQSRYSALSSPFRSSRIPICYLYKLSDFPTFFP